MMLPGNDYLAQARALLAQIGPPASERLLAAWPLFWKAMFHEPEWPTPLRQRAAKLVERMLQDGEAAASVRAMSSAQAQAVITELRQFIDDFTRHASVEIQIEPLQRERDTVQGN